MLFRVYPLCADCVWCREENGIERCARTHIVIPGITWHPTCRKERSRPTACGPKGYFHLPVQKPERVVERVYFNWFWFWVAFAAGAAAFWIMYAVIRLDMIPNTNPTQAEISATRRLSR